MGTMHPGRVCKMGLRLGMARMVAGDVGTLVSDARLIANAGHLCKWIDSFHVLVVMRCGWKEINFKGIGMLTDVDGYDMMEITWYYLAKVFNHMPSLSDTKHSHPYATCLKFDVSFLCFIRYVQTLLFWNLSINFNQYSQYPSTINTEAKLGAICMTWSWHDH